LVQVALSVKSGCAIDVIGETHAHAVNGGTAQNAAKPL